MPEAGEGEEGEEAVDEEKRARQAGSGGALAGVIPPQAWSALARSCRESWPTVSHTMLAAPRAGHAQAEGRAEQCRGAGGGQRQGQWQGQRKRRRGAKNEKGKSE